MRLEAETAEIVTTKAGDVIQIQQMNEIELSVFDSANRVAIAYLTRKEVREVIALLDEVA